MNVDRFSARRDVCARGPDVIFHVTRAQHAPRIDVLKTRNHLMRRLARRMHHHVQPSAMAHRHHRIDRPGLSRRIQDRIKERNQCGNAFQRKSLRAQITRLQHLLEKVRAHQPL